MEILIEDKYSLFHFAEIFAGRAYRPGLDQLQEPPRCVLDLGAYRGMFTLFCEALFRQRFGHVDTRYYLYEANGDLIPAIRRNLESAGIAGRATVFSGAVGLRSGRGFFEVNRRNLAGSAVHLAKRSRSARPVEYRNVEADLAFCGAPAPTLIKIDIEGAEPDFVKSYPALLSRASVLLTEYHRNLRDHSDWVDLVEATGLSLLEVTGAFPSSTTEIFCNPGRIGIHGQPGGAASHDVLCPSCPVAALYAENVP